ncbi:phosphopantothenoylcysteine decarboxylase [uncultured Maricaulis sp.]|uniref:phosphopantothenoylcysteine decarboxylase domain-containing protein n=1 Tax=uncultured Maricaulis sp. TaxID=174710 RepID=UPI0030D8DAFA|tara:strand:+ start:90984 stop:91631 length:648 start_codon:yes stop_codon:yes gene_type:complete
MSEPLSGRHVLITAGPTREPIDPVRYISNHSSGQQGYAIAEACAALGARVTLVSGPTALPGPAGIVTIRIETALQMLAAVETALPADVFIAVAAVADWRPAAPSDTKIKADKSNLSTLQLVENPDILKTISQLANGRPGLVIGFAAETHEVEAFATAKRVRKGCDWIVANDVSGDVMGGTENAVTLVTPVGQERWERAPKAEIAARLAARIAEAL